MAQTDRKRLYIFVIFISLTLVPVLFRLTQIMLFPDKSGLAASTVSAKVERGPILDRNGKILAVETKLKSVTAWMPDIENIDETATIVADILEMDASAVKKTLGGSNGFAYIKRKIAPVTSDRIAEQKKLGKLAGISLQDEYSRIYPQGKLASHLVGYVDVDEKGLDGIERTFEEELSPPPNDAEKGTGDTTNGNQVFLTIDINLQFAIEEILSETYRKNDADSCLAMVANAKTGEILAYCSYPYFNPNDIAHSTENERINHIAIQAYEPGSVFKVFTIASFLDLGGITKDDTFTCTGVYDVKGAPIKCQAVHGEVTALDIIKYSCNVGAAYASEKVEKSVFYDKLADLGFGSKTGIELPGETAGILNPVQRWSGRSKPAIAFGQEISVSAIQVLQAATALTNNGVMLKARIVKKIVSPQGRLIKEYARSQIREVFSPRTAWLMLQMMQSTTVGNGTARLASVEGFSVSAKTGTAEVYDPKTRKYSNSEFTPSILGIFPTENPAYIVYAVVHHPRGDSYFGSRIAAPLFKDIAEKVVSILKFPGSDTTVIEHPEKIEIRNRDEIVLGDEMPDLRGTPKRLLLPLFAREDISVYIKGEGKVARQSPKPGTRITEGMKITLELE